MDTTQTDGWQQCDYISIEWIHSGRYNQFESFLLKTIHPTGLNFENSKVTMLEDNNNFASIRFDTWIEAFSCARKIDNWLFRGQSNSDWNLQSTLERDISVNSGDTFMWNHCEQWMLRKFKGAAHHHIRHVPGEDDTIEWLALMQHHGAPTRLLDFTYSFAVSAYFAAKNAQSDFAIWAVNWLPLMKSVSERLGLSDSVAKSSIKFHTKMHESANRYLRGEAKGALVFPVDPMRQNERSVSQQGLFLFPTDCARTFEQNLTCLYSDADISHVNEKDFEINYDPEVHNTNWFAHRMVVKFILPKKERIKTIQDLDRINVHEASLFPGLDGFARSLKRFTLKD